MELRWHAFVVKPCLGVLSKSLVAQKSPKIPRIKPVNPKPVNPKPLKPLKPLKPENPQTLTPKPPEL